MPTLFKHSLHTQIGTSPTDVLEIAAGVRATVIGCNLANVTDYDTVIADVMIVFILFILLIMLLLRRPQIRAKVLGVGDGVGYEA